MSVLLTEPQTTCDNIGDRIEDIKQTGIRLPSVNRIPVATQREEKDAFELFHAQIFTKDGAVVVLFLSREREFMKTVIVEANGEVRSTIVGLPTVPAKEWRDAVTVIMRGLQYQDDCFQLEAKAA